MEVKRTVLKVQEVVYLFLQFREEKQTFAKVKKANVDFFLILPFVEAQQACQPASQPGHVTGHQPAETSMALGTSCPHPGGLQLQLFFEKPGLYFTYIS